MKRIFFLFAFVFSLNAFSQVEDAWFFIKDKPNSATFLANPLTMLSQQALDRRNKVGVSLDEKDVPIDKSYLADIKVVPNLIILGKSKWLNAVHVQAEKNVIETAFPKLQFLERVEFANKNRNGLSQKSTKKGKANHYNKFTEIKADFNYGNAHNQIKMLKGEILHKQGLTGKNAIIAILDGGFPNVDTLAGFKRLRDNNQILGGYNFADRNTNFYTRDRHGTHVLSTIGGYIENQFVGTAPDAKFYLFITEITETETVLEETLWVEAAERADSLGVDVINSSLGYTTFDNPNHDYTYADMDGKTTFISRGAEIAASRGILVVTSAGNSGNDSWKYISAPADAVSVISVGAVDSNGQIVGFSSYGPTSDNRIKPEVLAKGGVTSIINYLSGNVVTASGTSFSSPIMAGLIACLNENQSFLLKSINKSKNTNNFNDYLKMAVYESADRFANPTPQHGFGIPNFEDALNLYIGSTGAVANYNAENLMVYPNPTQDVFKIEGLLLENNNIIIYSSIGKEVYKTVLNSSNEINISFLKSGIYILKIQNQNQQKTIKLIKN